MKVEPRPHAVQTPATDIHPSFLRCLGIASFRILSIAVATP